MNRLFVPVLLVSLVIAGCADPGAGSSAGGSAGDTPQVSSPEAAPAESTATTTPAVAVFPVDFSRSGGFAGFDDRLHIDADGMMTVSHRGSTGKPVKADPAVVAALQQVLSAPNLASAKPLASSAICADGFRYRLSTPAWTYSADDCSGNHPEVERVFDVLIPLLKG